MENQLKATELRLGNKLQKENAEIFTVLRLDNTQDILVEEQRSLLTLGYNLFGIPLSEDILVKLGFEKGFHRYGLENYGLKCHKSLKENHWIVSQGFGIQFTELTEIQYLHQLQNLYFALTGEELTFKN